MWGLKKKKVEGNTICIIIVKNSHMNLFHKNLLSPHYASHCSGTKDIEVNKKEDTVSDVTKLPARRRAFRLQI